MELPLLASSKPIAADQLTLEFMMNGLRLKSGIDKDFLPVVLVSPQMALLQ